MLCAIVAVSGVGPASAQEPNNDEGLDGLVLNAYCLKRYSVRADQSFCYSGVAKTYDLNIALYAGAGYLAICASTHSGKPVSLSNTVGRTCAQGTPPGYALYFKSNGGAGARGLYPSVWALYGPHSVSGYAGS